MHREHTPSLDTFPRRLGGEQAVMGINLRLESLAPLESMPWVNSLRISLKDGEGDKRLILAPVDGVGRRFTAPMAGQGQEGAILAGLVSTPRSAEWFIYASQPCAQALADAIEAQFAELEVEVESREDPDWSVYREFLLPSALERHLIDTRRHMRELSQFDDDVLDSRRALAHTLWFSSPGDRNAFADEASQKDFALHYPDEEVPVDADEGDDIEYGLTITRAETIDVEAIDEVVQSIFKLAAGFGGEYEGWHVLQG
jgi:regulator of RNase E activity RraB